MSISVLKLVHECAAVASRHSEVMAPAYNEMRTEVLRSCPSVDRKLALRCESVVGDMSEAIGGTPLVALDRIREKHGIKCRMLAKAEFMSAGGSVKDRLARRMVELIEAEGTIKKGDIVVEATSGNTGIGLALMCAVRGYQAVIVMPEKMSAEKANTLKALGAIVIRTRTSANWDDEDSHIVTAYRLVKEVNSRTPDTNIQAFIPDQYKHAGNVLAHYQETAKEVLDQSGGRIDCMVMGAGTGGTVTGVAERLKEELPGCVITAVDPKGSILHKAPGTWDLSAITGYEVEGIGYDFYPPSLHRDVIDEWMVVDDHESFAAARELIALEGMLVGGSSGTAMAAALKKAKGMTADQTLVVLLPDSIRNYLTKFASDDWMVTLGFNKIETHPLYAQYASEQPDLTAREALSVLDSDSISLGQLPVFATSTTVGVALTGLISAKASHGIVRDATSGVLVAIVSADDLQQATLTLRAARKPLAEVVHASFLLVLPGSASLATLSTLTAAADGAAKSKNPAVILVKAPSSKFENDNLIANRTRIQGYSEVDQRSGIFRLVTKQMVTKAILKLAN